MDYIIRLFLGATLLESKPCQSLLTHRGGGVRNAIAGFSRASRNRMIKRLGSIRVEVLASGIWLDLTYPNVETRGRLANRHLKLFLKRLQYWFPEAKGIWKRELQERGAIHFHIMLWGVSWIPYQWIAQAWYEIVGSDNPAHLEAGTSVHRIHSARQAAAYASKYQSKEVLDGETIDGRWWGMFGDWETCVAEAVEWVVNAVGLSRVWRVLDNWRLSQSRRVRDLRKRSAKIKRSRRRSDSRLLVGGWFLGEIDAISPYIGRLITQS